MQLRAALFDLDNTLHDKSATLRLVAARQHAQCDLVALGVSPAEWASAFVALNNLRIEKAEVFERLARAFSLPASLQASLLEDFDANLGKSAVAFPGAPELLRDCKAKGLKVGVVTNGRDAFQRSKIAGMGLAPLVDTVVTSGAFGRKKPDPGIFLACLQQLGVTPQEAVFIGDEWAADIEPSLALGMRAIFKSSAPPSAPGAWLCTESLEAISSLLQDAVDTP